MKEIYDEFKEAVPITWMMDYIDHTRMLNAIVWIPKSLPIFIEFKKWMRYHPPAAGGLDAAKVLRMCNISMAALPVRIIGRTKSGKLFMAKIDNPYGPHKWVHYESFQNLIREVR